MIVYKCDTCSAVKGPEEVWIVGLAAEAVGVTSARRELNIQSAWNRMAAVHPLAVHFCSTQCKDDYLARLFAPEADVLEKPVKVDVPAAIIVKRTVPKVGKRVVQARKASRRKRAA